MIKTWLKENVRKGTQYSFQVIDMEESCLCSDDILSYLGELTVKAHREISFLKRRYHDKPKKELIEYIEHYVFPDTEEVSTPGEVKIRENVRQGDFGEIIAIDIVEKFKKLQVPIYKLRWKVNNNRSMFCTDIFAHNLGTEITDLKYYEVKTRQTYSKQLGIDAHNSLASDIPYEYIADYLQRYYNDIAERLSLDGQKAEADKYYTASDAYGDIVRNQKKYKRSFEIVLIVEKANYKENILETLNSLPPTLTPLEVTVILVTNLKALVKDSYEKAIESIVELVYE